MVFSENSMSILKGAGRRAVAVIVRLKAFAPYAMVELVLPGGSVMALLLWLYRRRKNKGGNGQLPMRLPTVFRLVDSLRLKVSPRFKAIARSALDLRTRAVRFSKQCASVVGA
jgi:hypothetical protein